MIAGGNTPLVSFLNLENLIWIPQQSLPYDIHYGASVPYGDSFLIVGGYSNGQFSYLDTIFYFNPETEIFELFDQTLSEPKDQMAAFLVPDNFALCS